MANFNLDRIREARVSIKMSVLVSALIGMYYVGSAANAAYVHWHDKRYAKRSEIITLAQAAEITSELDKTNKLATSNSQKLDDQSHRLSQLSMDFSTYAASTLVSQAKTALRNHIRNETDHNDHGRWLDDKAKLEAQLQKAEEYRNCVIEVKVNCGRFLLNPN